ncbi:CobW/HypB/UreG, nucleotide-binding domain-containing protein [Xylariaceae sp. FL0804]|nr:CobW/HypB/UreG, nucleotide-binding domain-containing protein [Xylariaceae sp. FL0804]
MAPIPITIVTGFLGSGKTTLLLNLVPQLRAANPDYRLALLKNEFGDVAVDSRLAASSAVSGVTELLGGCICCNLVGGLGDALRELAAADPAPDRIVVETSGSAFPATLALEVNRAARDTAGRFALDGVVSVVDVENWRGYEDTSYTARLQARYTDLVVLNKWELCDERRLDDVRDRLGDLEVDVATVKSDRGRVPVDVVFGIDGGLARTLTARPPDADADADGAASHGHRHDHEHAPNGHSHDNHQAEVEVLSVALDGDEGAAVDAPKLMGLLNAAPKDEVYRIKAVLTTSSIVRSSGEDESAPMPPNPSRRYILNWAFGRWTFTPLDDDSDGAESNKPATLRMTVVLARYESAKWKKKLEAGGLLELADHGKGDLVVTRLL